MAARFRLSSRTWRRVVQSPQVRAALASKAARIAVRARQLNAAEDGDADIHTESGTRPQGRSYARVVSTDAEGEFGTEAVPRRRLLGRAARST
jgi:hypothetical protein